MFLRFRMNLSDFPVPDLLLGSLALMSDSSEVLENYRVTSGLPFFQFVGSENKKGAGPIPSHRLAKLQHYLVHTRPRDQSSVIGIQGLSYDIDPISVKIGSVVRSEFLIHFDANAPGSQGCIAFKQQVEWKAFHKAMKEIRQSGKDMLPLLVEYNVRETRFKVMSDGKKIMDAVEQNGVATAPIKPLAEALGGTVKWSPATRTVTVNGTPITPLTLVGSVSHGPVRKIVRACGRELEADVANKVIIVKPN